MEVLSPLSAPLPAHLHVVFSAECIPAFDWQSAGLFYSFNRTRQPGRITRLLACSDDQLTTYPQANMDMGPTFVHRNMRFDAVNDAERGDPFHDDKSGHGYASYNKPFSVKAWLEQVDVEEEFVLMMDTDMYLRAPIDPSGMGCSRGTVVSAKYSYLYGTTSGFARHFIDESLHERMTGVGGFHIFHREDLRQIAPLWLEFTKKVRAFANAHPDQYFNESFHYQSPAGSPGPSPLEMATKHKQARWHGEMYGYVFAAAEVGVTHRVREDVMLYPGNAPFLGRAPWIMHYGADYTFGDKKAYFNKMSHQQLRLETCPNFLFDEPWDGTVLAHLAELSKQDALSTEHLATLNAAFCRFYARIGCSPLPERCGGSAASAFEAHIDAVQPTIAHCRQRSCRRTVPSLAHAPALALPRAAAAGCLSWPVWA